MVVFENKTTKKNKNSKLEIKMYGKQSCPYTKVMQEKIIGHPITYVEVKKDMDIPAVPYFVNVNNGKTAVGAMEIEDLLEQLK